MITVQIIGAGRPAPPIVLIHAFPLSSAMYRDAAAMLADTLPDRSIVLVDLPGFGEAARQSTWTISGAMKQLHHELAERGFRDYIVGGTSMGGYAAFAYYRLYSEEVEALIFSNTKAEADDEAAKNGREEYALDVERHGIDTVIKRQLNALVGETTKHSRPDRFRELQQLITSTDPMSVAAALRAMAGRDDSRDLLPQITCPTLVISSTEDTLMPSNLTKAIALGIERARYEEIAHAGHLSPFETPHEWKSVVAHFVGNL
jgi:3-oxoadipate enol-lactonase